MHAFYDCSCRLFSRRLLIQADINAHLLDEDRPDTDELLFCVVDQDMSSSQFTWRCLSDIEGDLIEWVSITGCFHGRKLMRRVIC